MFSDLQPYSHNGMDKESLYAVFFDGQQFHDRMLINDQVKNRYGKGVQFGDQFWLVYKYSMNYPDTRYMYHDIAVSTLSLDRERIETTTLIRDRKYNSSPDIAIWLDKLVAVYKKIEHLYGVENDPAARYGCFAVEIEPKTNP